MASSTAVEREVWLAAYYGDPMYTLLTTNEAADRVRVKPSTIRAWTHRGHLTRWCDDDRGRPLYRAYDVLAANVRMRHLPTPEEVRSIAAEWARHADDTGPA